MSIAIAAQLEAQVQSTVGGEDFTDAIEVLVQAMRLPDDKDKRGAYQEDALALPIIADILPRASTVQ